MVISARLKEAEWGVVLLQMFERQEEQSKSPESLGKQRYGPVAGHKQGPVARSWVQPALWPRGPARGHELQLGLDRALWPCLSGWSCPTPK